MNNINFLGWMDIDKDQFWGQCLNHIKGKIPEQAFQTWFDGVTVSALNGEGDSFDISLISSRIFDLLKYESQTN